MMNRTWPLDGVVNFRDFGGYEAADGGRVATGLLFRSAHFAGASDADLDKLHALGAEVVVDLRRPEEREREPNRWPGDRATTISNDDGQVELPAHVAVMMQSDLTAEGVAHFMHTAYSHYPYEPRYHDLFKRFLTTLVAADRPVVIHCAAGKDRTGVGCALALWALGVPRDAIFADYELTNTAVDLDARLPLVQAAMEERIGRKVSAEALRPMIGVRADYLAAALAAIDARSGSVERYLETEMGIGPTERAKLRARLLA